MKYGRTAGIGCGVVLGLGLASSAVAQLAECLMRAGSANDALRRYGPVAELLGSSAPAWPELDARLDVWLDTVREMDVKVWGCRRRGVNWFSGGT
jgi:hypothetical protein